MSGPRAALALATLLGAGPALAAPSCAPAEEAGRRIVRVEAAAEGAMAALEAALARAREDPATTVLELEGTFFLERPIELGPQHAGLVLRAGPRGARLLGGVDLSAVRWRRGPDGVLETRLDDPRLPAGPLDLHLDGLRLEPAREPDADPGDPRAGWLLTQPGSEGVRAFRARPGDLSGLTAEPGLSVLIYDANQWWTNLVRVARLDARTGLVELADNVDWYRLGPGTPFFFAGSRRFLDRAGEWHFDPQRRTLALLPPDDRGLAGRRLVAATLDTLLAVRDTARIAIRGLELGEGSPHGSDRAMPWNQIGGGAIRVDGARAVALCDNRIRGVGVGIALHSVEDVLVRGNRIQGTAGNGIYLGMPWGGRPSRAVRIEANRIEEVGHRFADSAGVLIQGARAVVVVDNRIERTGAFAIYGAQTRGNGEDRIHDIRIEHNLLRDSNLRTADGGAIKLFAATQDEPMEVVIRANWIDGTSHLMVGPDGRFFTPNEFDAARWPQPVSFGIYLDWYARGVVVEGNLLTRAYGGIAIVNGSDNLVRGNWILGGPGAALVIDNKTPQTSGRPPMAGNRIEANLVVRDHPGSGAAQLWDLAAEPGAARFRGNLYWGSALGGRAFRAAPKRFPGGREFGDLALWRSSRYVAGPEHGEDPGILFDPVNGELRVDPRGAVARLGIPPLDPWLLEQVRGTTRRPE
ncbi:MAG: right-handed parallel beta-helix repeat-containing protein [Geminicoccaceae bacterium]|nr:right-handed parallel beta-helix repeat-containing protein [Geminicoccaceae bacterium]MDW8369585.1 right-handed parallel beta-helix repeat-containing protein [Geminicoccaceae bacterium]